MRRALAQYTRRSRFRHPGPPELLDAFESVLGREAAATLRGALFDEGWVDYAVDDVRSEPDPTPGGSWSGSVLVRRRGTLSFPVEVDLVATDGSTQRQRWDGHGDWTRLVWDGRGALRGAIVDPDEQILVDQDRENNQTTDEGLGGGAPRTLERAFYWMELALQAASP